MLNSYQSNNLWYIVLDDDISKPFKDYNSKPLTFIKEVDANNFCEAHNNIYTYTPPTKPDYWSTLKESQDIMEQTNNFFIKH